MTVSGLAHAQTPSTPPADLRQQGQQQERRQQERDDYQRDRLQPAPGIQAPDAPEAVPPWPAEEAQCHPILDVVLEGPASETFQWALDDLITGTDPAIGRCLGTNGISIAAARAQRALVGRGYVTSRILFQPQNLGTGRLTLTFMPGRVRAVRMADSTDAKAMSSVRVGNAIPARPGEILNIRDVEQGLENLQRVPTAQAHITMAPAEAPDMSDLVVSWRQAFPLRLTLAVDDSGAQATGKYQGSATLSYDHWWTLNDLFYLTANHDLAGGSAGQRGTRGYAVHYSLPWDYWLLGATASSSRYHQTVAGLSQDYIYRGISENAEIKLSRLVSLCRQPFLTLVGLPLVFNTKSPKHLGTESLWVPRNGGAQRLRGSQSRDISTRPE